MSRKTRITAIGGGTGLSTLLRGLKKTDAEITAIVAMTDDGGGSGILRKELGMPPPGDIRNCILALANAEPAMETALSYRFTKGSLAGQSLGNLMLAALNDLSPSFDKAVSSLSEILAITGRVLPSTNENVVLRAEFSDGAEIIGQTSITRYKKITDAGILNIHLQPEAPESLPEVTDAIDNADLLLLGPGSLYTSVLPNLLIPSIAEHIAASNAKKLYICNIMTQDGETEYFTASRHVQILFEQTGKKLCDSILINNRKPSEESLSSYENENASPVVADYEKLEELGLSVFEAPISTVCNGYIRHDSNALAQAVMDYYSKVQP